MININKKNLILSLIISELIALFFWPVWKNLNLLNSFWPYRWLLLIIAPLATLFFIFLLKKLEKKWPQIGFEQIGKFILTGALNTFLDFGLLNFFSYLWGVYFGWALIGFNTLSFFLANGNSYLWNRYWVFSSPSGKEDSLKKNIWQFGQFLIVSVIGFLINSLFLIFFVKIFSLSNFTPALAENLAKLISTLFTISWNFLGYKYLVFRKLN